MPRAALLARSLVIIGYLVLTCCKTAEELNYQAVLSLPPDNPEISPHFLVTELTARAELLRLPLDIRPVEPTDRFLEIKLHGSSIEDALARLNSLCVSGKISIRAIHDRSAYLTDIASKDPSRLPQNLEILLFDPEGAGRGKGQKLAVERVQILDNSLLESVRATPNGDNMVHISLTDRGL